MGCARVRGGDPCIYLHISSLLSTFTLANPCVSCLQANVSHTQGRAAHYGWWQRPKICHCPSQKARKGRESKKTRCCTPNASSSTPWHTQTPSQQHLHLSGSQLKANAAAMSYKCAVCLQTFLCTSTEAKLKEHQENKHPKNTPGVRAIAVSGAHLSRC